MPNLNNIDYRKWLVNFTKSVAYSTKEVILDEIPNATGIVDDIKDAVSTATDNARDAISNASSGINSKELKNSKPYKEAMNVIRGAARDIKTGDFAHLTMDEYEFGDDIGVDMDFSIDEVSADDDENGDIAQVSVTNDAKLTAIATINTSNREIMALSQMSDQLQNSQLKSSKAIASAVFQSTNVAANMLHNDITATNQRLDVLNQNIASSVKFNTTQSKANEAALKHYARMEEAIGMMMSMYHRANGESNIDREGKKKSGQNQSMNDLVNYGFNSSVYGNMIKENLKAQGVDSISELLKNSIGMVGDMYGMGMKTSDILNLQLPMKAGIKKLLPKRTMTALSGFDKRLPRMINTALGALGEKAGTSSPLSAIAEILGIKINKTPSIKLGDYEKGAMQWSGTSKKALEEVIPGYLASIEKTLKEIRNPNEKYDERLYDYDKGVYRASSQIREDFRNNMAKQRQKYYEDSKSTLEGYTTDNSGKSRLSDKSKKQLHDGLQDIINDAIFNDLSSSETHKRITSLLQKTCGTILSPLEISDISLAYLSDINKERVGNQTVIKEMVHGTVGSAFRQYMSNRQQTGYNDIRRKVWDSKKQKMVEIREKGKDTYGQIDIDNKDIMADIYDQSDEARIAISQAQAKKAQQKDSRKNTRKTAKSFMPKSTGFSAIIDTFDNLKDAYENYDGLLPPEIDQAFASYLNAGTIFLQNASTGMYNPKKVANQVKATGVKGAANKAKQNAQNAARATMGGQKKNQEVFITSKDFRTALSRWNSKYSDQYANKLSIDDYNIRETRGNGNGGHFISATLKSYAYYPGWPKKVESKDIDPQKLLISNSVSIVSIEEYDKIKNPTDNSTVGHGTFRKSYCASVAGFGKKKKAKTGGTHKKNESKETTEPNVSKKPYTFDDAMKKLNDTWDKITDKLGGKDQIKSDLKGAASGAVKGSIAGVFLPTGPIGGALLGAAAGIMSSRVDFKKILFGDKIVNEYGDVIGIKKTGLVDQWKNTIQTAFVDNLQMEKDATKDYIAEYFKNKVEPEIDYFMKDRSPKFKAALDSAGNVINKTVSTILHPVQAFNDAMNRLANKTLTAGTKLAGIALRGASKLLMEGIAAPFKIGSHIKDNLSYGKGNVVKGDISNFIHGKATGLKFAAGRLSGKIDSDTSYDSYRNSVGAAGIKFNKDGSIDYSDIEKERDQALADLDNDKELNTLKESNPNEYKKTYEERKNNILAQFTKKQQAMEYRQNAWDKDTKTGAAHRREQAENKRQYKARAKFNKTINKYNKKDAGKFVNLTEEEASERYEALKATIADQPEDIRKAFEMIDPKNAADIQNFINNRQNFVKMKTSEKAADEAKGDEAKYRAMVTNGIGSTNKLIAQGLNFISGGVLHPEVNEKDNSVDGTRQMSEDQVTSAQATTTAKVSSKVAVENKDPENNSANTTDSNDATGALVGAKEDDKKSSDSDEDSKESKSIFEKIVDFFSKDNLTGIWDKIKGIGSTIKNIGSGLVDAAGVVLPVLGIAASAKGALTVGAGVLNAFGIGKNQKTKMNETLGNVDIDGNRTAYVDTEGNLTTADDPNATQQISDNSNFREMLQKAAITGTAGRAIKGFGNIAGIVNSKFLTPGIEKAIAKGGVPGVLGKIAKTGQNAVGKVATPLAKVGSNAIELAKYGATKAVNATASVASKGFNAAKVAGAKVADTIGVSDIWKKVVGTITRAIEKLSSSKAFKKIVGENGSEVIDALKSKFDDLLKLGADKLEAKKAVIADLGQKLIGNNALGVIKKVAFVATATWDVVSGLMDAANLFRVKPDDVDMLMRSISIILKLLSDLCPVADVVILVAQIASELLGYDFLHEVATLLYNTLYKIAHFGSNKGNKLGEHQQELMDECAAYNAANGTSLSINAYNDMTNKTLGSKVLGGIKGAWNKLTGKDKKSNTEASKQKDTTAYVDQSNWSIQENNDYSADDVGHGSKKKSKAKTSSKDKNTKSEKKTSFAGKIMNFLTGKNKKKDKNVGHGTMVSQYDSDISNLSMGDGYNVSNGGCGVATMANMLGMSGKSAYDATAGHRTKGGMTSQDMLDSVRNVSGSSSELSDMDSMNSALNSGKNVAVLGDVGHGGDNAHWINVTSKNSDGTYNWQDPETGEVSGYLDPNQIDSAIVGRASTDKLDARVQKNSYANSMKYNASRRRATNGSARPSTAKNKNTDSASTEGTGVKLVDNGSTIQNGSYYFAQNGQSWSNQNLSGFSGSPVNNYGCVMTSAAMGVSDLLGKAVDPGTLNSQYGNGNVGQTNFKSLGIDVERLPPNANSSSSTDPSQVQSQLIAALKAGKPVMLYGTNAPSKVFHDGYSTSGSHCVLATGIDENGNLIVNNPYSGGQTKYANTHWPIESLNGLHWIQIMSKDGKGASGTGVMPVGNSTVASVGSTTASSYAAASGNATNVASNSAASNYAASSQGAATPTGVAGLADNGDTIQHGTFYFAQNDPRWAGNTLSGYNSSVKYSGCVMTSAAMGASGLSGKSINPGTFNSQYGNGNVGSTKFSDLGIDVTRYPSNGSMSKVSDPSPYLDTIRNALANRMPVMLYGDKTASNIYMDGKAGSAHCIIATGLDENGNVVINNPWDTAQKSYAQKTYPLTASSLQPFHWAQVMSKDGKGIDGTSGFTVNSDGTVNNDGTTGTASVSNGSSVLDAIKNGFSSFSSLLGNLGSTLLNNVFKNGGNGDAALSATASDDSWKSTGEETSNGDSVGGPMPMPSLQQSAHNKNFISDKTIGRGTSKSGSGMDQIPSQLDTITSLLTTIAKNTSSSGHGHGDFGGSGKTGHGTGSSPLVTSNKTQSQKNQNRDAAASQLINSTNSTNFGTNSTSSRLRANHEKIASGYRGTVS